MDRINRDGRYRCRHKERGVLINVHRGGSWFESYSFTLKINLQILIPPTGVDVQQQAIAKHQEQEKRSRRKSARGLKTKKSMLTTKV